MTWRPSKSPRECSGINRRDTVSCFVIHKYGNGKQRLLVPADPCASFRVTQSQRVHTKEEPNHDSRTPATRAFADIVRSSPEFQSALGRMAGNQQAITEYLRDK